jgi:hypothetical protein
MRVFPLVLIVGQQKRPETQKQRKPASTRMGQISQGKNQGSEFRADQSSCAKKQFVIKTNHICTELLQKLIPNTF